MGRAGDDFVGISGFVRGTVDDVGVAAGGGVGAGGRAGGAGEVMGLSQASLGAKAGISAAMVSDIENDRRPVGLTVGTRLAAAFGIDVRLVLGNDL